MLKPAERQLLGEIESAVREQLLMEATLVQEKKRLVRLKAAKTRLDAEQAMVGMTYALQAKSLFVKEATARFFKGALDIETDGVVALLNAAGEQRDVVIVHMMRARQLSDGSAVLTVSGDAFDDSRTLGTALVVPNVMLMAAESSGERLVSLA